MQAIMLLIVGVMAARTLPEDGSGGRYLQRTPEFVHACILPQGNVLAASLSTQPRSAAVSGSRGGLWVWQPVAVDTPRMLPLAAETPRMLLPMEVTVNALAFSDDGATLVAGGSKGQLWIWTSANWTSIAANPSPSSTAVSAIAVSPDRSTIALGLADGRILLCNPTTGEVLNSISGSAKRPNSLAFGADGRTLLSVRSDGTALIHDIRSLTLVRRLKAPQSWGEYFVVAPNAEYAASFQPYIGLAVAWKVPKMKELRLTYGRPLAFTKDDLMLVAGPIAGTRAGPATADAKYLIAIEPQSGHARWCVPKRNVIGVSSSSDGKWIAAWNASPSLSIWSLEPIR